MRICPQCRQRTEHKTCPDDHAPTVDESLFVVSTGEDALIGRVFGERYRVDGLIGRGGMGWVFRATHVHTQQILALKVMRRDHAQDLGTAARFYQEARACARLSHPHTIRVFDYGVTDDGFPYLAMEYLTGRSLAAVLDEEGALAVPRAIRIVKAVCRSLHEAHLNEIVHRDLKPENVFLAELPGESEWVKVLDFGIAKSIRQTSWAQSLTSAGALIGTPLYMAPEQVRDRPLDGRTDIYSLGAIFYEMLCGYPPFRADDPIALLFQHVNDPPPAFPCDVRLPAPLRDLVMSMLAKDPDARPASALAISAALDHLVHGASHAAVAPGDDADSVACHPLSESPVGDVAPTAVLDGLPRPSDGEDPLADTTVLPMPLLGGRAAAGAERPPTGPRGTAVVGGHAAPEPVRVFVPTGTAQTDAPPGAVRPPPRPRRARVGAFVAAAVAGVASLVMWLLLPPGPSRDDAAATAPDVPTVAAPSALARRPTVPVFVADTTTGPLAETPATGPSGPAALPDEVADTVSSVLDPAAVEPKTSSVTATAPAPAEVAVRVVTTPPGARVIADESVLGVTPLTLSRASGTRLSVRLELAGRQVRDVEISFDKDATATFALAAARRRSRSLKRPQEPQARPPVEKAAPRDLPVIW